MAAFRASLAFPRHKLERQFPDLVRVRVIEAFSPQGEPGPPRLFAFGVQKRLLLRMAVRWVVRRGAVLAKLEPREDSGSDGNNGHYANHGQHPIGHAAWRVTHSLCRGQRARQEREGRRQRRCGLSVRAALPGVVNAQQLVLLFDQEVQGLCTRRHLVVGVPARLDRPIIFLAARRHEEIQSWPEHPVKRMARPGRPAPAGLGVCRKQ